jgi:exodeoxyribonuclease V alpha subunit
VLSSIAWRSEETGFTIGRLCDGSSIKGTLREASIGLEWHFLGRWVSDPRWGWTFIFEDARAIIPTTTQGVRDYLRAHAKWVGPEISRAIVTKYGADALTILKTDPARVASEIKGITLERASEIKAALIDHEAIEAVEVDVRGIVGPAGVNARQIRAILDRHGRQAAIVCRENPYRMIEEVDGVGWATADRIGKSIGIDPRAPARIRAGMLHVLREAEGEGHTCMPGVAFMHAAATLLSVPIEDVGLRFGELANDGELVSLASHAHGGSLVFRSKLYRAERSISSAILRMLSGPGTPPELRFDEDDEGEEDEDDEEDEEDYEEHEITPPASTDARFRGGPEGGSERAEESKARAMPLSSPSTPVQSLKSQEVPAAAAASTSRDGPAAAPRRPDLSPDPDPLDWLPGPEE